MKKIKVGDLVKFESPYDTKEGIVSGIEADGKICVQTAISIWCVKEEKILENKGKPEETKPE